MAVSTLGRQCMNALFKINNANGQEKDLETQKSQERTSGRTLNNSRMKHNWKKLHTNISKGTSSRKWKTALLEKLVCHFEPPSNSHRLKLLPTQDCNSAKSSIFILAAMMYSGNIIFRVCTSLILRMSYFSEKDFCIINTILADEKNVRFSVICSAFKYGCTTQLSMAHGHG